jgi:putative nucleotidyltransferase with HDIG domain
VFHVVAIRLQQVLHKPNFSIDEVTQLITADQGLSSQVLRVANSAFYAGLSKVTNIREAIVRLGSQEVANIAMMATQADVYRSTDPLFSATMQTLWQHALGCAVAAKWLAAKVGYATMAQEAFLAGLLHDVGKLFLLKVVEELSTSGRLQIPMSASLINEVLNSMHVEQGYTLMKRWNMPELYSDIVRDHHLPDLPGGNTLLAIVRLVNLCCNKLNIGMRPDADLVLYATAESQFLGAKEIVLAELELVIEDTLLKMKKLG